MLLSIITVCYNAEQSICETVNSVLNQNDINFEYLLIDGKSKDNTVGILQKYKTDFNDKGIKYKIVSEPDKGIYDAMNKGARIATGDWVLYLNSGDKLFDPGCVKTINEKLIVSKSNIIYGDTLLTYYGVFKPSYAKPLKNFCEEIPFCHQSVLTRRELLLDRPYDLRYKICADYDFYLEKYCDEEKFEYIRYPISVYEMGGFSSNDNSMSFWKELFQIQYKRGIIDQNKLDYKITTKSKESNSIRKKIVNLVPDKMVIQYRKNRLLHDGWRSEKVNLEDFY